jgi:hypothetical protein
LEDGCDREIFSLHLNGKFERIQKTDLDGLTRPTKSVAAVFKIGIGHRSLASLTSKRDAPGFTKALSNNTLLKTGSCQKVATEWSLGSGKFL